MKNEELEKLQLIADETNLQVARVSAKLDTILSMILGVYIETLPPENSSQVISNLCNLLQKNLTDAVEGMEPILFDHGKILRTKFEIHEDVQHLRRTFGVLS